MTDGNYQAICKVLGKYAYAYDQAGTGATAQTTTLVNSVDQSASQLDASLDVAVGNHASQMQSTIANGATSQQALQISTAKAALQSAWFTGKLVTNIPAAGAGVATIIGCLQLEMAAAADNKTLGTAAATGLVHFLAAVLVSVNGAAGLWNTEADATADYRDAIYCVSAVV